MTRLQEWVQDLIIDDIYTFIHKGFDCRYCPTYFGCDYINNGGKKMCNSYSDLKDYLKSEDLTG